MNAREYSHYAPWDAAGGRVVRALCGTFIRRTGHSNTPTCPVCRDVMADEAARNDRALAQLKAMPSDPASLVPARAFDPCADYRPRIKA